MAFFIRGAEMLLTALGVPVGCEGCRSGNSPEFRAQQKEWLETSTRGKHIERPHCKLDPMTSTTSLTLFPLLI